MRDKEVSKKRKTNRAIERDVKYRKTALLNNQRLMQLVYLIFQWIKC